MRSPTDKQILDSATPAVSLVRDCLMFEKAGHPTKPGMLHQAGRALCLDLTASVMVGDRTACWEAGRRTILVSTGNGKREQGLLTMAPCQPDHIADGPGGAVESILADL